MATIKEIAKACNVSVATVSNILNDKAGASDKTRQLVMKKAEELNYTPNNVARSLRISNTKSIGVLVEDMTIFSIPDIVDGITDYFDKKGYQILLTNLRLFKKFDDAYYFRDDYYGRVKEEIRGLLMKQVGGIIYVSAHERPLHCIPDNVPVPTVMAYAFTENPNIPSVVVDDEDGAYHIVKNLLENGHKRIGVITGKSNSSHMQERLLGYQRALYENGVLYDPSIVCIGDWNREAGYKYTDELLKKEVTAVFCMNDLMAGGVYDRLEELGLEVGEDLSLVGYDNRQLASYYKPTLSTVTLPLHDIGYCSGEVMIEMLESENKKSTETIYRIKCETVLRKSVKKI